MEVELSTLENDLKEVNETLKKTEQRKVLILKAIQSTLKRKLDDVKSEFASMESASEPEPVKSKKRKVTTAVVPVVKSDRTALDAALALARAGKKTKTKKTSKAAATVVGPVLKPGQTPAVLFMTDRVKMICNVLGVVREIGLLVREYSIHIPSMWNLSRRIWHDLAMGIEMGKPLRIPAQVESINTYMRWGTGRSGDSDDHFNGTSDPFAVSVINIDEQTFSWTVALVEPLVVMSDVNFFDGNTDGDVDGDGNLLPDRPDYEQKERIAAGSELELKSTDPDDCVYWAENFAKGSLCGQSDTEDGQHEEIEEMPSFAESALIQSMHIDFEAKLEGCIQPDEYDHHTGVFVFRGCAAESV